MAASPEDVSLADVVLAVQGVLLTMSEGNGSRNQSQKESPSFVWDEIRDGLRQTLERCSLADLCREASSRGVDRADPDPVMYEI